MNKIFLTFDYEIFLGTPSGGIDDCLLEPTSKIIDVLKLHKIPATFYVDFAFLFYLQQSGSNELDLIRKQLETLKKQKHSIQFHLHPHWIFKDSEKNKNLRYYINEYSSEEIIKIIKDLLKFTEDLFEIKFTSYRAGGLINETISDYEYTLKSFGFETDSSVLDFQNNDFLYLKQFKISTTYYNPLFYWRLVYQRYFKNNNTAKFGKGNSLPMPNSQKLRRLFLGVKDHLSFDSNKWIKLENYVPIRSSNTVILSHPKAMNKMSIVSLSNYIERNKKTAIFKVL